MIYFPCGWFLVVESSSSATSRGLGSDGIRRRSVITGIGSRAADEMLVTWNLGHEERNKLLSARFAEIVEAHGGTIRAESSEHREGTARNELSLCQR